VQYVPEAWINVQSCQPRIDIDELLRIADVRAITPSFSGFSWLSCLIIPSVNPSLQYSWVRAPLMLSKGSTANSVFRWLRPSVLWFL
jgi:hypothetical protein